MDKFFNKLQFPYAPLLFMLLEDKEYSNFKDSGGYIIFVKAIKAEKKQFCEFEAGEAGLVVSKVRG